MSEVAERPNSMQIQVEVWTDAEGRVHGLFAVNRQPGSSAEASQAHTHLVALAEGLMQHFQAHYLQENARTGNGKLLAPKPGSVPKLVS